AAKRSADALAEAVSLYRGDLLAGLNIDEARFDDWLRAERQRLRELAVQALSSLVTLREQRGAVDEAVRCAIQLLALDPSQESAHRHLMHLYARQGRRGAALRQYQLCVATLQRELSAEPELETKQLYRQLLLQQVDAPDSRRVETTRRGPKQDAVDFETVGPLVGRGIEVSRLRGNLDEASRGRGRVVLLLGEAGIGKTRLLGELARVAMDRGFRRIIGRCY